MKTKKTKTPNDRTAFRKSLVKLLPGYNWTVHKPRWTAHKPLSAGAKLHAAELHATGIQSSGFNRLSTIEIVMQADGKWFTARIAGFGTRAPWLGSGHGNTLAQAVRKLQSGLEHQGAIYCTQANTIQAARTINQEQND